MKKIVTVALLVALGLKGGSVRGDQTATSNPPPAAQVPDQSESVNGITPHPSTARVAELSSVKREMRPQLTEAQRWERFEKEYGVHNPSESTFKSSLQHAKYGLDRTVFAMDEFVENVEDAVEFDYWFSGSSSSSSSGSRRRTDPRTYFSPLRDAQENAHLRSDVDLNPVKGEAWLGLRLIVPIGD